MTIDFAAWLSDAKPIAPGPRAVLAWRRINDKPSDVVFTTPAGSELASQKVRVEHSDGQGSAAISTAGRQTVRHVVVFGVRDHPDADVADTDIKSGYTFIMNNAEYRVNDIVLTLGEIQAHAEVIG